MHKKILSSFLRVRSKFPRQSFWALGFGNWWVRILIELNVNFYEYAITIWTTWAFCDRVYKVLSNAVVLVGGAISNFLEKTCKWKKYGIYMGVTHVFPQLWILPPKFRLIVAPLPITNLLNIYLQTQNMPIKSRKPMIFKEIVLLFKSFIFIQLGDKSKIAILTKVLMCE